MAWNLLQNSMKLATKFNGTWGKIQWRLGRNSMELAAKANGAGCNKISTLQAYIYVCAGRCLRMCDQVLAYVLTRY